MKNSADHQEATAAQRKAITHGRGPLLIAAGPGSGKTYTLVERLRYLTEEQKVRPEQILMLTFSRAAAENMKSRAQRKGVTFGTFHSVFFHILIREQGLSPEQIASDPLRQKIMEEEAKKESERQKAEMARFA